MAGQHALDHFKLSTLGLQACTTTLCFFFCMGSGDWTQVLVKSWKTQEDGVLVFRILGGKENCLELPDGYKMTIKKWRWSKDLPGCSWLWENTRERKAPFQLTGWGDAVHHDAESLAAGAWGHMTVLIKEQREMDVQLTFSSPLLQDPSPRSIYS